MVTGGNSILVWPEYKIALGPLVSQALPLFAAPAEFAFRDATGFAKSGADVADQAERPFPRRRHRTNAADAADGPASEGEPARSGTERRWRREVPGHADHEVREPPQRPRPGDRGLQRRPRRGRPFRRHPPTRKPAATSSKSSAVSANRQKNNQKKSFAGPVLLAHIADGTFEPQRNALAATRSQT